MMNGALEMNKWILALIRLKWRRAPPICVQLLNMHVRSLSSCSVWMLALSLYLLCAGAECEFACARLYIWMCMLGRNCCADANSFANHPAAARLRFPISYWPLAHNADIAKQGTYRILHTAQFSAQKVTRTQHPTVWFLLKGHKIASTGPANCTKFARVEKSP